ncbi:MAG: ABC transporter ATP-binding protein [Clostridia bacterium]|nr:ABC transporter ATP-binding protein [Clostridia bacterium]
MTHLIELKDAYKIYNPGENEVHALDGVSLTIDYGDFVAIVGQSGSGKSTLMNMLGLLDVVTSGTYILDGRDIKDMDDDELSTIRNEKIGFIFQGFNLIPSLTAQGNVELPLIYRGMKADERHELSTQALKRVGLEKRMNHLPSQMSGGQQQRVAIARAVAAKPPVILADEPTGNLDSASGKEVMKIINELWNEGKSIILITHDDKIAEKAHRVIRISDGKVIEDYVNENITAEGNLKEYE